MLETMDQKGPQSLTLSEQASLFMVFALGVLIRDERKSETFFKQALFVGCEVFSETSTESVSLAFLIGFYQQITAWLLVLQRR
jgi:hypothetical protein